MRQVADDSSKNPWWVSGRNPQSARTLAIIYTVVFVLYGSVAIGTGRGGDSPWTVVLIVLWGVVTAWGWFSFWWLLRHRR